jgi:hypothetical protein
LTGIYLCNVCSCQEILRRHGRGQERLREYNPGQGWRRAPPPHRVGSAGGGAQGTAAQQLIAIDCEMCDTQRGHELTRLSVTDVYHRVLLDMLVKPPSPIVDCKPHAAGVHSVCVLHLLPSGAGIQQHPGYHVIYYRRRCV